MSLDRFDVVNGFFGVYLHDLKIHCDMLYDYGMVQSFLKVKYAVADSAMYNVTELSDLIFDPEGHPLDIKCLFKASQRVVLPLFAPRKSNSIAQKGGKIFGSKHSVCTPIRSFITCVRQPAR